MYAASKYVGNFSAGIIFLKTYVNDHVAAIKTAKII